MAEDFEIICEIQPPTSADLSIVRQQIAVLQRTCDAFLVPDSHLGRATVSSVAVAHEVDYLRGRAMACINARDRNLLGLRRDLLTAAAYGVEELLFVYGDKPQAGGRSDLTVRRMLEEVREIDIDGWMPRVGVAADVTKPLPDWKRDAHFVFTQVSYDLDQVGQWREDNDVDAAVYAGVMVMASEKMADRLAGVIPGLHLPDDVRERLRGDGASAGVEIAIEQLLGLREAGEVDGVQLIPARRFQETAVALERAGL